MTVLSKTQKNILKMMADGRFHSSRTIAAHLGISRTAAWHHMQSLEDAGIELYAVHGKGTRLAQPLCLLDRNAIESALEPAARQHLNELILLDETPSTNLHLMLGRNEGPGHGLVCLAEMQTQGKGRQGRTWVSPFAQNIYMSVLWRFVGPLSGISGLSLACGVQVCQALKALGVEDVGLKWPNDLLWQGKKLGGILVEVQGETEGSFSVVVGLGLNFQMGHRAAQQIDQPWVDVVSAHSPAKGKRNALVAHVINGLLPMLANFPQTGLQPYVETWNALDCLRDRPVRVISGAQEKLGVTRGISMLGELLLQDEAGVIHPINGGEVSLRAVG